MQQESSRLVAPRSTWARLIEPVIDLFAPRECAACAEPPRAGWAFCDACGDARPAAPSVVAAVPLRVAGAYAPPLSQAIGRFKFEGHPELATALAGLLAPALHGLALEKHDYCVPVPLHATRLVERGYNQAALLARRLAARAGMRCVPRLLERTRVTDQQARLGRDERGANMRDAFRVRVPPPAGRVLLVDDVVTTGATLAACIEALCVAGCEVAGAVALARAGS